MMHCILLSSAKLEDVVYILWITAITQIIYNRACIKEKFHNEYFSFNASSTISLYGNFEDITPRSFRKEAVCLVLTLSIISDLHFWPIYFLTNSLAAIFNLFKSIAMPAGTSMFIVSWLKDFLFLEFHIFLGKNAFIKNHTDTFQEPTINQSPFSPPWHADDAKWKRRLSLVPQMGFMHTKNWGMTSWKTSLFLQ